MNGRTTTRQRILDESRRLFNERGYAGTTIAEIAEAVGITEGNLWYHFRSKLDIVAALEDQARLASQGYRTGFPRDRPLPDSYVEIMFSAMRTQWDYRFLLRDALQLTLGHGAPPDPDMAADHAALHGMLRRMNKEGLLRRDPPADLEMLSRSLFIVSRYWGDYLREVEGLERLDWPDQERGFRHHMAVLFPYLTASARRAFEAALERVYQRARVA